MGTYVFYDSFASPKIATYIFYNTFVSLARGPYEAVKGLIMPLRAL